jgi:hypothetical protein
MILIAMTCVATLLLLVFGALWRQTLVLSRSSGPHYSQRGSMTSVPFRMHRMMARQSIAFFSLFEDREAHDARITGRGYAFGCRVAERPVALPPQTMEGACPRSTRITSTLEIASGGPPGPGPRSSDSNS